MLLINARHPNVAILEYKSDVVSTFIFVMGLMVIFKCFIGRARIIL